MKFEIITLFPDYFSLSLKQSLIGKAWEKQLFDIEIVNLRDFATDKHHKVDDTPFGGGGGMVLKLEPLDRCLKSLGWPRKGTIEPDREQERLWLTSAAGQPLTQDTAIAGSLCERVTIICGHYLGVDERLLDLYDVEEVSIGDYVLSGGEPAALVMVDAIARLIPKVLGNFESALGDSHMDLPVGPPVYTRPAEYEGLEVPATLMSGDHKEVERYRRLSSLRKCRKARPDLFADVSLTREERASLDEDKDE